MVLTNVLGGDLYWITSITPTAFVVQHHIMMAISTIMVQ